MMLVMVLYGLKADNKVDTVVIEWNFSSIALPIA